MGFFFGLFILLVVIGSLLGDKNGNAQRPTGRPSEEMTDEDWDYLAFMDMVLLDDEYWEDGF